MVRKHRSQYPVSTFQSHNASITQNLTMRVLLCLLLGASLPLYSQTELAIIDDPDGYTNIRAMESSESEIVGKLYDDQAFYLSDFDDIEKEWLTVSYSGKENLYGFIHRSRVKPIGRLPGLIDKKEILNELTIEGNNIQVKITTGEFFEQEHTIERHESGYISSVDGKGIFGTGGELPHDELTGIEILDNGKNITIPQAALTGIHEIDFNRTNVFQDGNSRLLIVMHNSDGAYGYSVIWVVEDGKFKKRQLVEV